MNMLFKNIFSIISNIIWYILIVVLLVYVGIKIGIEQPYIITESHLTIDEVINGYAELLLFYMIIKIAFKVWNKKKVIQ